MEDRFWAKVLRRGEDDCWEWTGNHHSQGYGKVSISHTQTKLAHRVAWELTYGPIPEGMIVRHKCRGKCVNPRHLELGTDADNARDKIRDGTSRRGTEAYNHILTEDQVREIRRRLREYERGMIARLGEEYGVCRQVIGDIKRGKTWAWLDDE
jgi:hypothetical protein